MKILIILLSLLLSASAIAKDGPWASNRIRVGYDQLFTSVEFKLSEKKLLRTSFDAGLAWKINDIFLLEPRYVLKLPKFESDPLEHQLRLALKFTFD
jgi:uncharacterized membrane protein YciS (DUF1049 family)